LIDLISLCILLSLVRNREDHTVADTGTYGSKISQDEVRQLTGLRMHWEDHYTITVEDGVWQAIPKWDDSDILIAETSAGLLGKMKDHYAYHAAR
jgi:hypothetical protein